MICDLSGFFVCEIQLLNDGIVLGNDKENAI